MINWSKSNIMVFSKEYMECKVEVEGVCLEQVRETIYLAVRLSDNGEMESEFGAEDWYGNYCSWSTERASL